MKKHFSFSLFFAGLFLVALLVTSFGNVTEASAAPIAPSIDVEEQTFISLVNQYRAKNGLGALVAQPNLTAAARWMSTDMAAKNYFSHTDSLGRDPFVRIAAFGFTGGWKGENLAAGRATANEVLTQWINSPAHNANLLRPQFRTLGVARVYNSTSTYKWYWSLDFGN